MLRGRCHVADVEEVERGEEKGRNDEERSSIYFSLLVNYFIS